jgi:peptide subunit release factor 1 (eRF1)/intein/homing endonuclease/DNA-binding XRE family transcriptional regulator
VTVYVPAGYELSKITTHLQQEQGTATNIKSSQTRKNVIDALERMIQHLKLFDRTPENGLALFSGNVAEREGQSDVKVWSIDPPLPLNIRMYRCDKQFVLDPLEEQVSTDKVYGMVVLDRRDATIAELRGKKIVVLKKTHSEVPGKMRAGGQCLHPDTQVSLADGRIMPIRDVASDDRIHTRFMEQVRIGEVESHWSKKKQLLRISTTQPKMELICSPDHTIFTARGEVPAKTLTEHDWILYPKKINVRGMQQYFVPLQYYNSFQPSADGRRLLQRQRILMGYTQQSLAKEVGITQTAVSRVERGLMRYNRDTLVRICALLDITVAQFLLLCRPMTNTDITLPLLLTSDFAQLLGYLIGDGSIETDRLSFFEQDQHVAEAYMQLSERLLSKQPHYRFRSAKNYHQLRITSRPLVRMIRNEFPEIAKARTTSIPLRILQSPDDVVAGFVRGIFDAEGYVASKLALGMNNETLMKQLQILLLRFGIIASLQCYDNKRNPYSNHFRYTLEISDRLSLEHFTKYIGLTSEVKSNKLHALLAKKTYRSYHRTLDLSGKLVRSIIEKEGGKVEDYPTVNAYFRDEQSISQGIFMQSIINQTQSPRLKEKLQSLLGTAMLRARITSIRRATAGNVIDIAVDARNFIANGMLVHNSAPRFARLREGATKEHYKKIAEYMKHEFLQKEDLSGIIIGGPSTTVTDFLNKDYLTGDLKKKILGTKDLCYTDEFGLQEMLDQSSDLLEKEEVAEEKKVMKRFFETLHTESNKASYGKDDVMKMLEMGAVDICLISETVDDEVIDAFEEKAAEFGSEVKIISMDIREGEQLRAMGGFAAILRYPADFS